MKFYASGQVTDPLLLRTVLERKIPVLTSFAYENVLRKQVSLLSYDLRAEHARLEYMLDSGAFTAWSVGKNIDLNTYCATCNEMLERYGDCFEWTFVALDKIPGKRGAEPSPDELKQAATETLRNYEHMLKVVHGNIKPVFHLGDPDYLIDAYKAAPYIGLGASQNIPYEQRRQWVARTSGLFANKKLHGLAMTGTRMLRTAPWHSVDSASWILWSAYGAIAWVLNDGTLKLIPLSSESPRRQKFDAHLTTLPEAMSSPIFDEIMDTIGASKELLMNNGIVRKQWNLIAFDRACQMAEGMGVLKQQPKGLFDDE